jgi:hypothetical protein
VVLRKMEECRRRRCVRVRERQEENTLNYIMMEERSTYSGSRSLRNCSIKKLMMLFCFCGFLKKKLCRRSTRGGCPHILKENPKAEKFVGRRIMYGDENR